jgi:glutamate synthase (NADPH/NADH) small chain
MNKSKNKVAMPEVDPAKRILNYEEVSTGYTPEMALEEANRCLDCKNPKCIEGCPVGVRINDFIRAIKEQDFLGAYEYIQETNAFPSVCGRVCPQESQCEAKCIVGIKGEPVAIGRLERFVGDWFLAQGQREAVKVTSNGIKVAVVGSGPVSLSCASDLAKLGYEVTVFEVLHKAGGVLTYGIPSFRLPKDIVEKEIDALKQNGVTFQFNTLIGRTITIEELREQGYKAIFIGSGAGLPKFMGIKGENSNGVFSANEILTRVNLMRAVDEGYDTPIPELHKVMVVGGGNVAMDAARVTRRMGAEVHVVYRRSMQEMPARLEEIEHAKEEGIIFDVLMNPVEIIPDEQYRVKQVVLEKMNLGEPDEKGRRSPVPSGEFVTVDYDCVIIAVGTTPNPLIRKTTPGLETTSWGGIIVNEETMETTIQDIYAGGDAVSGAATVISALGAGKKAAKAIHESLQNQIKA